MTALESRVDAIADFLIANAAIADVAITGLVGEDQGRSSWCRRRGHDPLTGRWGQAMMTDPVVLVATGDTFQRDSIRAWLRVNRFDSNLSHAR
jgi:hypothetical protein